jgi:hypothetical protein
MAYKEFTLKDAAGVVRTINLSTDPRYPVAMDGFNRPRNARDQEMPEAPDRLDPGAAVQAICEILAKVGGDPDAIMSEVAQNMAGGSQDAAGEYPQRGGYTPAASGATVGRLPKDAGRSLGKAPKSGFDSVAMDRRDPVLAGYLNRIRLGGR